MWQFVVGSFAKAAFPFFGVGRVYHLLALDWFGGDCGLVFALSGECRQTPRRGGSGKGRENKNCYGLIDTLYIPMGMAADGVSNEPIEGDMEPVLADGVGADV